eukprot:765063-Hanusia_phi.AAC.9
MAKSGVGPGRGDASSPLLELPVEAREACQEKPALQSELPSSHPSAKLTRGSMASSRCGCTSSCMVESGMTQICVGGERGGSGSPNKSQHCLHALALGILTHHALVSLPSMQEPASKKLSAPLTIEKRRTNKQLQRPSNDV